MSVVYDTNVVRLPTGSFGIKLTRRFPTSDKYRNVKPKCTITKNGIRLRIPIGMYRVRQNRRWLVLYLNLYKKQKDFLVIAYFRLWRHRLISYDQFELEEIDKTRLEPLFPTFSIRWLWEFIDKFNGTVADATIIEAIKLFVGLMEEKFMHTISEAGF